MTSRSAFVPLNQSAESFAADDFIEYDRVTLGWWVGARRRQVPAGRVGAIVIVVAEVFTNEVV